MVFREKEMREWTTDRQKWLDVKVEALADLRSAKKRKQLAERNLNKQDEWLRGQK